jgi:hypothetical protein
MIQSWLAVRYVSRHQGAEVHPYEHYSPITVS